MALHTQPATITINIDPIVHLGPVSIAWHGLMIAAGIGVGGWFALRYGREIGLDPDKLLGCVLAVAIGGIVGARFFYLLLNDPSTLGRPSDWLGTRGFAFYGALILGPLAAGIYLRRERLSFRYLDALAAGFPAGMAIGRVGDLISGEHYGPPTHVLWGIRYLNPHAEVPSSAVAYHSGGLYEIVLALVMVAIIWPLRYRFRRPGMLLWAVIALYAVGRFVMFFYRSDTDPGFVGLNAAQLISVALLSASAAGGLWSVRLATRGRGR